MKIKGFIGSVVIACACAQAAEVAAPVRGQELENNLDCAIGKLDVPAVKAALDQLEQSGQHIRLLPRLKKLQAAEAHKRYVAKWIAWPSGIVAIPATFVGGTFALNFLDVEPSDMCGSILLATSLVGAPLTAYALYKRWARRMHERKVVAIAQMLTTSRVCVVGTETSLVAYALNELGVPADKAKA